MMIFYNEKFFQIKRMNGTSSKRICHLLNISRSTLWTWEKGRITPSEIMVRRLAEILDIPVSQISSLPNNDTRPDLNNEIHKSINSWLDFPEENCFYTKELHRFVEVFKKLQNSEIINNALLSSYQSILFIKDINLKYITINKAMRTHLKLLDNFDAKGKLDNDFFSKNESELLNQIDLEVLSKGKPIINKENYIPGSRKNKWGLISVFPILNKNNKIIGLLSTIVDITEKKRKDIINSLLEKSLSSSHDVAWLKEYSRSSKFIYISDSIEQLTGYSKEYFINDNNFWVNNCMHPEDIRITGVLDNDSPTDKRLFQFRIKDKNGHEKWVEANTSTIKYFDKKCNFTVLRDITSRKQSEYIRELLEANVNSMKDALYIINKQNDEVLYYNSAFEKLFYQSFEYDKFNSRFRENFAKRVHPDDKLKLQKYMKEDFWPENTIIRGFDLKNEIRYFEVNVTKKNVLGKNCRITVIRDKTEDFKTKEQLNTLINVIEELPHAVWIANAANDRKFSYYYLSNSIEALTGYPKVDFIQNNKNIFQLVPENHQKIFKHWLKTKMTPVEYEHQLVTKNGTIKWIETKISEIKINNQIYFFGTHSDVTEKKELYDTLMDYSLENKMPISV